MLKVIVIVEWKLTEETFLLKLFLGNMSWYGYVKQNKYISKKRNSVLKSINGPNL